MQLDKDNVADNKKIHEAGWAVIWLLYFWLLKCFVSEETSGLLAEENVLQVVRDGNMS